MAMAPTPTLYQRLPDIVVTLKETWTASSKGARVFWLVVFILCLVCLMIEIVSLFKDYLQNPTDVVTHISTRREMTYPMVVVCADYPMNYTAIRPVVNNNDDYANFIYSSMFEYGFPQDQNDIEVDQFDNAYRNMHNNVTTMRQSHGFLLKYGLQCQSVFKLCTSQHEQFNCCDTDNGILKKVFMSNVGQCFIIQPPAKDQKQTFPGPRGALHFIMGRQFHFGNRSKFRKDKLELRWHVSPISPFFETKREAEIDFNPTIVKSGQITDIRLNPQRHALLGPPFEPPCTRAIFSRPDNTTMPYQLELCYRDCEVAFTVRECGCIRIGSILYEDPTKHVCTPKQHLRCAHAAARRMTCDCPIPCHYIQYHPQAYTSQLPVNWEYDYRQNGNRISYIAPDEQISILRIFYSTLIYHAVEQIPKWTLTRMLASIGGQCSLWLGVRIFTVIQLIYYSSLSLIGMSKGGVNTATADVHEPMGKGTQTEPQIFPRCDTNYNADAVKREKLYCNNIGTGATVNAATHS